MKNSKNKSLIKGKVKTDIANNNKIINKMNNNFKNNILKTAIDKSISKNELKIKMKTNNNSILKACFSNINNTLDKKGIFVFEDMFIPLLRSSHILADRRLSPKSTNA